MKKGSAQVAEKEPQRDIVNEVKVSYDVIARNRMQHQLAFDSESFVLNQLVLSVQFFEHFERYEFSFHRNKNILS